MFFSNVYVVECLFIGVGFFLGTPSSATIVMGSVCVAIGILLRLWCGGHLAPGVEDDGDIAGPWRFVRHPEVVGRFLSVFGLIFMAKAPFVFACAVLFLGFFYRLMVIKRDRQLASMMGPAFAVYRLFVPSLLPHMLPVKLPHRPIKITREPNSWSYRRLRRSGDLLLECWIILCVAIVVAVFQYLDLHVHWMRLLIALILVTEVYKRLAFPVTQLVREFFFKSSKTSQMVPKIKENECLN